LCRIEGAISWWSKVRSECDGEIRQPNNRVNRMKPVIACHPVRTEDLNYIVISTK
jgi:hypothetical protein